MQLADKEIARLCRALAQLQHAGISLSDGVHLLRQQENGSLNALLSLLGDKMDTGVQLSQAMEDAQVFPLLVIGMIRIGENTGRLEESLQSLGEYFDERCRTARQIRSALTYPSLMMLLMLAVIAVLLVQVLPDVDGGMIPAFEIMQANNAVRNMIRENKTYQIDNAISTGAKDGMLSMDQSIQNLYRQGRIEKNTALAYADKPDMMKRLLT